MSIVVTVAWRNLWRRKQRSVFTALAMGIGVALSMVSMSLQTGIFAEVFDEMVTDTLGHVQVHHPDYPIRKHLHDTLSQATGLVSKVEALPEVRVAAPRLLTVAMVGGKDHSTGALVMGVEPHREVELSEIDREISLGRWMKDVAQGEAVLGRGLAEELEVKLGEEVILVGQDSYGGVAQGVYRVVGQVESGIVELDHGGIWLHLRDAQDLFVLPDQVHELLIAGGSTPAEGLAFGEGRERVQALSHRVKNLLQRDDSHVLLIQTWREARPAVSQLMDTQRSSAYILLSIVLALSALGVLNTMLMAIFERTRELGVMLAVGIRPATISLMVMTEALLLASLAGILGLLMGWGLNYLLMTYGLDFSVDGEGLSYGGVRLSARLYGVFEWSSVTISILALYFVTIIISIWPAIKAAQIEPITAMKRGADT